MSPEQESLLDEMGFEWDMQPDENFIDDNESKRQFENNNILRGYVYDPNYENSKRLKKESKFSLLKASDPSILRSAMFQNEEDADADQAKTTDIDDKNTPQGVKEGTGKSTEPTRASEKTPLDGTPTETISKEVESTEKTKSENPESDQITGSKGDGSVEKPEMESEGGK